MYRFCDDHEWVGSANASCPECEEIDALEKPICKICGLRGEHKMSCPKRSGTCHWACTGCDVCGSKGHGESWF